MMRGIALIGVSMVALADCFSVPVSRSQLNLRSTAVSQSHGSAKSLLRKSGTVGLVAGVDPGTALPNLDALYFSGVAIAVVGAGILQAQAGAGPNGLGKYLSTGPEDKNWERKQAKANEENKARMNEEGKGSFFANLLPKLDFVEVYGQEKLEQPGRGELERLFEGEIKESDKKAILQELDKQLDKAIEREDMALAAEIQSKMAEIKA